MGLVALARNLDLIRSVRGSFCRGFSRRSFWWVLGSRSGRKLGTSEETFIQAVRIAVECREEVGFGLCFGSKTSRIC